MFTYRVFVGFDGFVGFVAVGKKGHSQNMCQTPLPTQANRRKLLG